MIQYFVKYSIGVISEEIKIKIHHDNIDKLHCLGLKTLTEKYHDDHTNYLQVI